MGEAATGPTASRWRGIFPRGCVFLVGAGIVVAYALPGGAYDVVIRQEYALVLWAAIAVGFALGVLPRSRPSRPTLAVLGALTVYVVWCGVSLAWTQSAERTTAELARAFGYLGLCVLIATALERRFWRDAAAGLAFGALLVCALAVASRLAPSSFPISAVTTILHVDRLSYPFGYWNAVGAWAAMSIALGLGWSTSDASATRRTLMLAGVPVAATAAYLSYSRASVGGAALGVVLVLVLSRRVWTTVIHVVLAGAATALTIATIRSHPQIAHGTGTAGAAEVLGALAFGCLVCAAGAQVCRVVHSDSWRLPGRLSRDLAIAGALLVLLGSAVFGPHLISRAWHQFRTPTLPAAGSNPTQRLTTLSGTRYELWAVALDSFDAHPISGTGAGTYEFIWNQHQRTEEFVINAHSIWLETMSDLGLPGLIALVAFAGGGLTLLMRIRRRARRPGTAAASTASAAAFAVFLLQASVDWMWQSTAVTVLALGALMTATSRLSASWPRLRWQPRAVVAVASAAAAAFQLPGLLSALETRQSQTAERAGQSARALAWARAAHDAEPWAASPLEQEGLVLEAAGELGSAAVRLRQAVTDEPTNYTHWLILARIETEQGLLDQAARDYARAHELRTMGSVFGLAPPIRH